MIAGCMQRKNLSSTGTQRFKDGCRWNPRGRRTRRHQCLAGPVHNIQCLPLREWFRESDGWQKAPVQLACHLKATLHRGAGDGCEVLRLKRCIMCGLARCVGMGLNNEEGSGSQDSVRPASWQQQHRQHKPDCNLVHEYGLRLGTTLIETVPESRISQSSVISKCCRRGWT